MHVKIIIDICYFFYFLTMSNYQWIYGVSDKTQLLIFFYRLHKMLQIFKMFKNQSKQTKINKGQKKKNKTEYDLPVLSETSVFL